MIVESCEADGAPLMLESAPGAACGGFIVEWTARDAILIALAAGMSPTEDLDYLYEARGPRTLPTLASAVAGVWLVPLIDRLGCDRNTVVLGETRIGLAREMPGEGKASVQAIVLGVDARGENAKLVVEARLADRAGELAIVRTSIFLLGKGKLGWRHGDIPSLTSQPAPQASPMREARMRVDETAAATYRLIFPLRAGQPYADAAHIDPSRSRSAGFAQPVVHGQTLLGMISRGILAAAKGARRFAHIEARFAGGVVPGSEVVVRLWPEDGLTWRATMQDAAGRTVVQRARVVLAP